MFYAMLVTVGESRSQLADFLGIVRKHYGQDIVDALDIRLPYAMIEKIPYGDSFRSYEPLLYDLNGNGFTVWLVTEPQSSGHAEVVYNHQNNRGDGIRKLQRFASMQHTPA